MRSLAFAAGAVVAVVAWGALRPVLATPLFARRNHRDRLVPTAGGLVLVLAVLVVEAGLAFLDATGAADVAPGPARSSTLVVVLGLALLGLVDDLGGSGADGRGFRGHVAALAEGRLTTGGLKLLGGGAVAVVACAPFDAGRPARLVADALLVALAANLGNLFDRAPGRTVKVSLVAFVVLGLAAGLPGTLTGVAVVVGAGAGLLAFDLRERLMLGDTGANALGGALGLGVVLTGSPSVRLVVLAGLVVLNLASEVVSFSRVIDAVPPLRALDRAGRRA